MSRAERLQMEWLFFLSSYPGRLQSVPFQSVSQSSPGLAGLERANEPRRELERGSSVCPRSHALSRATILPEGVLAVFCVVIWLKLIIAKKQFLI